MDSRLTDRITLVVAAAGALLTMSAYALMGGHQALSALAGVGVAMANWFAIRWVARQGLTRGSIALLAGKTLFILLAAWILIARAGLDAGGFLLGLSALVVGIVGGPLTLSPQDVLPPDEDGGEPEES